MFAFSFSLSHSDCSHRLICVSNIYSGNWFVKMFIVHDPTIEYYRWGVFRPSPSPKLPEHEKNTFKKNCVSVSLKFHSVTQFTPAVDGNVNKPQHQQHKIKNKYRKQKKSPSQQLSDGAAIIIAQVEQPRDSHTNPVAECGSTILSRERTCIV